MKNFNKMAPSSCYCGQNGDTTQNMLECVKCKRWFHEGCVKCLDIPMLIGDRFYIFICSVCNASSEYLGRIEMEWDEIVHLLLYNLTIVEKKKYFHLDSEVIPFLLDNWEKFHLFGNVATSKKDARTKVLQAFETSHNKFKCGKEVKKCKDNWALRIRVPPEAPNVVPLAAHLKKDVVVWDFRVDGREYHTLSLKRPTKSRENCKNGKHKSKLSAPSSLRHKNEEVSKCRGSVPHSENGITKAKHKIKCTTSSFNEDSSCLGLLDSLIPFPPDFKNCNNPFRKSPKKGSSKRANSQYKTLLTGSKRKRLRSILNNDLSALNGNHCSDDSSNRESASFLTTKEDLLQRTKEGELCILGKRTTSSGKVQYLIERPRVKLENDEKEPSKSFQITYMCNCLKCKRYEDKHEVHPVMWK